MGEEKAEDVYFRTGTALIDLVVGGAEGVLGFRAGTIINLVGDKSAGKSFLASEIVARSRHDYKKRFEWNYDDAEHGYTFNTENLYGFDMTTEETLISATVEDMDVNLNRFIHSLSRKKDKVGNYTLDSLDGLSNKELEERSEKRMKAADSGAEFKEGTYGTKTAKFLSQEFFRTKAGELENTNILLVIVSQVRENMDGNIYSPKYIRAGGKALDHYCHTVLWLYPFRKIEKEGRVVGWVVRVKAEKSKTPRPYRECLVSYYFDYGFDDIGSSLDYLYDLRGKDGCLLSKANCIGVGGEKEENLNNIKAYLKENDLYEKVREFRFEKDGTKNLSVDVAKEFMNTYPEYGELYQKVFGEGKSRDQLISEIEDDPELAKKLEREVIEKWEAEEKKAASNRKRKYS